MPVLEILHTGNFNGFEISEQILDEIIANSGVRVPVTFGHDQWGTAPAAGLIKSMERVDMSIVADIDLTPEGAEAWNNKEFHNWSAGIGIKEDSGAYLYHLALLGNEPPAIKDLKIIELSDKGGKVDFVTLAAQPEPVAPVEPVVTLATSEDPEVVKLRDQIAALENQARETERRIFAAEKKQKLLALADRAPVEAVAAFAEHIESPEALDRLVAFLSALPSMLPEPETREKPASIADAVKTLERLS